ncbi:ferric reductase [Clostridium acetobutylicum]|nr:ferric reductase [Clostridium acetobutylicum]
MVFIWSLIFIVILSVVFTTNIKKNYKGWYVLASLISILVSIYEVMRIVSHPKLNGVILSIEQAFMKGNVAIAFFILVMFAGALSTKQVIGKKLMSIRAELAILGSILILPHGIIYFVRFLIIKLPKILNGKANATLYLIYISIGIIAFIIMIPLFITSFKSVRKRLGGFRWKKLHKWSYVFYCLIYLHIILALLNGKINFIKITLYTFIFMVYTVMKFIKHRNIKLRRKS